MVVHKNYQVREELTVEKLNILFDLDDTLSHCNKYFDMVLNEYLDTIVNWFKEYNLSREAISKKQTEIDLGYVNQFGLTSEHFIRSFVETYEFFCQETGREKKTLEIVALTKLALSVYEQEFEPYPHTYDTLEKLKREGHNLFLHTGGEEKIQKKKITQLQLATYFENRVFISKHKDTQALRNIVEQMNFDIEKTWMIGNSLRTDIAPALEIGINAIYIPAQNDWHYNIVEVKQPSKSAYLKLNSLAEVPEAIQNHYLNKATNVLS